MSNYVLVKEDHEKLCYLENKKIGGLRIKPKNQVTYDGVVVNKLLIIKTSFIQKLLKKKVKRKLDLYLKYIVGVLEEDDTSNSNLNSVLDDLKRYKSIVDHKYRIYLDEKYIELLLKKIELLEHELKTKLFLQNRMFQQQIYEEEWELEENHKKSR